MVMNFLPNRAPRLGPNGRVTIMDLIDSVRSEVMPYLQDRGPIDGSGARGRGIPKGGRGVVLSFEDGRKERIIIGGYIPSRMNDKAQIYQLKISDAQATFIDGLANIIPRAISYVIGLIFFLHTRLTAEFIEDVLDSLCFMKVGLATQDQIICK